MVNNRLRGCYIATSGKWSDDYNVENMKRWISQRSGTYQTTVNDDTTHLVVTEDHWHEKRPSIVTAHQRIKQGQKIKIVKFDWLDAMINNKNKVSERRYLWADPSKDQHSNQAKPTNKVDSNSHQASVVRAFEEHTNALVDDEEVRRAAKRQRQENEAAQREHVQGEKDQEARMRSTQNPVVTEIFKKNAKRAAKDILSENYNIYRDSNGFAYDVIITKVAPMENKNERWAITIYESNTAPHTYAVNAQFSGTSTLPKNEIITSIGSTWETAFRRFKAFFKQETWINWEDRIEFAMERNKRERASRSNISASKISPSRWSEEFFTFDDFAKAPFQYEPPAYGPRELSFDVSLATVTHTSDAETSLSTHKQNDTSVTSDEDEDLTPAVASMSSGIPAAGKETIDAGSLGQTREAGFAERTADGADAQVRDSQDTSDAGPTQTQIQSSSRAIGSRRCQAVETESLDASDCPEPSPCPDQKFTQLTRDQAGFGQQTMSDEHNSDGAKDSVLGKRRSLEERGMKAKKAKATQSNIDQHEHAGRLLETADSPDAD